MIKINGYELEEESIFPGGEVHIKLPDIGFRVTFITVEAKIRSSDDIMKLIMIKDALDRQHKGTAVALHMFYFPYARQDRVCNSREAFSLEAFIKIIDSLNFCQIVTFDLHSGEVKRLIHTPIVERTSVDVFNSLYQIRKDYFSKFILVAPDAGAHNKTRELANSLNAMYITANKERGLGSVSYDRWLSTEWYLNLKNTKSKFLIVDDICDGGATFIELAKVLKPVAETIELYVTHGIFSKGLQPLFGAGIDKIYTTKSITTLNNSEGLEVWEI